MSCGHEITEVRHKQLTLHFHVNEYYQATGGEIRKMNIVLDGELVYSIIKSRFALIKDKSQELLKALPEFQLRSFRGNPGAAGYWEDTRMLFWVWSSFVVHF